MIKIKSGILATLALAAFGFVACSHDYSNAEIQNGDPVSDYNSTHVENLGTATVKYLTLDSYTANSSDVTPDFTATVSQAALVTATDLTWTPNSGLTHSQWDVKLGNNGVTEAQLEEQLTGDTVEPYTLGYVSFTITAVRDIKLKTISAITSSGKGPTGMTCYVDDTSKATGSLYSGATKAYQLSDASLGDIALSAGDTAIIKITCDKDETVSAGTKTIKIDFSQIVLTVEDATE